MAVYRSDQAQLTFSTEAAPGGVIETAGTVVVDVSAASAALDGSVSAGQRYVTVNNVSGTVLVGNFFRVGAAGNSVQNEIIKIEHIEGTTVWWLDAPLAFNHGNAITLVRISSVTDNEADQFVKQIPGIYETIDTPDPEMAIEPRYFLGTQSARNFFAAYKGQQTYTGSVSGIIPLNGTPLRFPIGRMVDIPIDNAEYTNALTFKYAVNKGDIMVTLAAADSPQVLVTGEVIYMWDSVGQSASSPTNPSRTAKNETAVIKVGVTVATGGTVVKLKTPLRYSHAAASKVQSAGNVGNAGIASDEYITHHIIEDYDLDSVTWHVHMRDSGETGANDFDRRYYGGKIGATTLTAEEGGMLTMGWDGVNFLGMKHNQKLGIDPDGSTSVSLPFYNLMQTITSTDVNFPTEDPYYFSQGQIKLFGETIARIRSFSLSISNNEEPRYYVSRQLGNHRGPTEIPLGRREYGLSVTLALPDSGAATTARKTLWSELLLEGDYGAGMRGFNVELSFIRGGLNDSLTIRIPDDYDGSSTGENESGAVVGGNQQGAFIRTAPHSITTDNPFQVEADIFFRNMKMIIIDSKADYV